MASSSEPPTVIRRIVLLATCLACAPAVPAGREPPGAAELVDHGLAQMRADPEASRQAAEDALAILAAQPDPDLELRAHLLLCDYQGERDLAAANRQLAAAQALAPTLRRPGLRSGVLACEGDLRENAGENSAASALYDEAVAVAELHHDDEMLGDALFKRGFLRGVRGDFSSGLADLKRAHSIYEARGMTAHTLTVQNAIATLYNRLGDHAQARDYYLAALKAQSTAGLLREEVVTRHNLGRSYENLGDWDAARTAYQVVLTQSRRLHYDRGAAYALRGLASVNNARGDPTGALDLLHQAAALQAMLPDLRLRGQIELQRGIALRLLKRAPESAAALREALRVFVQADSLAELSMTHGELAETLAELGDWRAAFEEQRVYKRMADQLLSRQLDERFATLKVEYDTTAKDQELRLLQREQVATENALAQARLAGQLRSVAMVLAAGLVAVLGALVWRHRRTGAALSRLALTDSLTGLPNRRDVLARLEARLRGDAAGCTVLLVDIDHFKQVNDGHGHQAGDEVLRAVASVLGESLAASVCVGRLGGEEFVVVFDRLAPGEAMAAAERLRARVEALDVSRWAPGQRVTVSVGVATSCAGESPGALFRRADDALYEAKRAGRNRVVVHGDAVSSLPTRPPLRLDGMTGQARLS